MPEKLKQLVKNKNNLIVIVLIGILLLVIAIPTETPKSGFLDNDSDNMEAESKDRQRQTDNIEEYNAEEYGAYMEQKLENALSRMEGAGQVEVVIAMKSSEEKVVEKDQPMNRSDTKETDSNGGTREVSNLDSQESTVYGSNGNASEPYVVKVIRPEVEGVLVLAEGAGTGSVSKNISEAVQVLFGIEAHKIRVVKMETP